MTSLAGTFLKLPLFFCQKGDWVGYGVPKVFVLHSSLTNWPLSTKASQKISKYNWKGEVGDRTPLFVSGIQC